MSWCRWSSMEFACDLYVYESESGVEVNVAAGRHVIDHTSLPSGGPAPSERWWRRQRALAALLDGAPIEPIGLPHDGESRTFDTLTAAANWIDELAALGYVVPEGMTADMRAEEGQQL